MSSPLPDQARNNPENADTGNRCVFLLNNPVHRQELLTTAKTIRQRPADYIAQLRMSLRSGGTMLSILLHYMPDRWVVRPAVFSSYLEAIRPLAEEPEALLLAILEDINNQVVPRWVLLQIDVHDAQQSARDSAGDQDSDDLVASYRLMVEDQQPGWQRPTLVNRVLL